jgi:hypothetical protein
MDMPADLLDVGALNGRSLLDMHESVQISLVAEAHQHDGWCIGMIYLMETGG